MDLQQQQKPTDPQPQMEEAVGGVEPQQQQPTETAAETDQVQVWDRWNGTGYRPTRYRYGIDGMEQGTDQLGIGMG